MINKAIEKVTDEAMRIDDPLAFAIEECITAKITSVDAAQKVLAEDKKLEDIYVELISKARKSAKTLKNANGIKGAGFDIEPDIIEYYGLNKKTAAPSSTSVEAVNVLDLF